MAGGLDLLPPGDQDLGRRRAVAPVIGSESRFGS